MQMIGPLVIAPSNPAATKKTTGNKSSAGKRRSTRAVGLDHARNHGADGGWPSVDVPVGADRERGAASSEASDRGAYEGGGGAGMRLRHW